jgi:nickel transport protein
MQTKSLLLSAACVSVAAFAPQGVLAHTFETNFQVRFDTIELEASFGEEEVFADAPVVVFSPENPQEPVMVGRTDEAGKFTFQTDTTKAGDWTVEIGYANDNHWDRLTIPVQAGGIDASAISAGSQPEHSHDYFAYSFLATIVGLGVFFGTRPSKDQA